MIPLLGVIETHGGKLRKPHGVSSTAVCSVNCARRAPINFLIRKAPTLVIVQVTAKLAHFRHDHQFSLKMAFLGIFENTCVFSV